jgi:hypothetical protein
MTTCGGAILSALNPVKLVKNIFWYFVIAYTGFNFKKSHRITLGNT